MISDKIEPMGIDLTKNLHGHVRVETRDKWTGRVVDSQEKDNLVTNAVQNVLMAQAWGTHYSASSNSMFLDVLPLYEKALGGLILFDNTLTESASNTYLPTNAKVVGMAGQTSDSVNALKGSLNGAESVFTSNGFVTVWDFLTSQANGTISSLARTSYRFVTNYANSTNASFTLGSASSLVPTNDIVYLGYDDTNKYLYLCTTSDTTINGISYPKTNIYRAKADFSSLRLIACSVPPVTQWTLIKTLSSSDGTTDAYSFYYDKYNNNFVYGDGETIHLIAMDGTHTTLTATGTSGAVLATRNYYWRSGANNAIYCIDKTDPSNIQTYTINRYATIFPTDGDVVYMVGYYGRSASYNNPSSILYPDGTRFEMPMNEMGNRDVTRYMSVGPFCTSGSSLWVPAFYLGTIANLNSPVTKTSSQTMKITYTLTEA